jgi:hypothetical protein
MDRLVVEFVVVVDGWFFFSFESRCLPADDRVDMF